MNTERASKRGMHMPGRHIVVERGKLKVGSQTSVKGKEFDTLTAARKAAKSGSAIVRAADGIVVSVR